MLDIARTAARLDAILGPAPDGCVRTIEPTGKVRGAQIAFFKAIAQAELK